MGIRYDGDLDTLRLRLDRPCLEFQFRTPEAAAEAVAAVAASGSTTVPTLATPDTARFVLDHETTPGTVLSRFSHLLPDILHMTEIQRPLRDLLADIYGVAPSGAEAHARQAAEEERERVRREREAESEVERLHLAENGRNR